MLTHTPLHAKSVIGLVLSLLLVVPADALLSSCVHVPVDIKALTTQTPVSVCCLFAAAELNQRVSLPHSWIMPVKCSFLNLP